MGGGTIGITGRRNSKAYEIITASQPGKVDEKRISGKYQSIGTAQYNGQTKNFNERPWHSVEVWHNFIF